MPDTALEPFLRRLEAISSYFERYRRTRGSFACYKHPRVTHWGKLAYLLPINGFLFERTGDERYLDRGLALLEPLRGELRCDEGRFILGPGRLNKYNASNNAIDSGAIVDSLCDWHDRFAAETPEVYVEFIRDACTRVAESYLQTALGKVTNQALWAMTGLAAVHRSIDPREEYRATCLRCLRQAFEDQNPDGSFPYLPLRLAGEDSPSLHDVSGYYHSRHLSFLFDVADKIGHKLDAGETERSIAAADFLCALYSPRGTKSLEIEAKQWYWMAEGSHEWASACFDYHALSEAHRRWRKTEHGRVLAHAARNLLENADADGAVRARKGDRDFKCTHFWSAHFAWVAKALDAYVPSFAGSPGEGPVRFEGAQSGVVCVRDERTSLQFRAKKPPLTLLYGSHSCSVTDVSVALGDRWSENLLRRRPWSLAAPGEIFQIPLRGWIGHASRTLFAQRREYRFALALAYQNLLVRRFGEAVRCFADFCLRRSVFLAGPLYSSFWCLENEWSLDGSTLSIAGRMSRADGSWTDGGRFEKVMTLGEDEMRAELTVRNGPRASIFVLPAGGGVTALSVDAAGRRIGDSFVFRLRPNGAARIAFRIAYGGARSDLGARRGA